MQQSQKPPPPQDLPDPVAQEAGLADTAFFALGVIRQQYRLIVATALFAAVVIAAACLIYLLIAPLVYVAKTQLVIERGKSAFLHEAVVSDTPVDSAQVESEIQILTSQRVAGLTVKALHLADAPGNAAVGGGLVASLKRRVAAFLRSRGLMRPKAAASGADPQQEAAEALLRDLQVTRVGLSFILSIIYQSDTPEQAVRVADGIAEAYIFDQMDSKYKMQRQASDWLQSRLNELRQQAMSSEEEVNAYKTRNNIVTAGGAPINEQEVGELNKQLVDARTKTSDILARLDRTEAVLRCVEAGDRPTGERPGADCPDRGGRDFYGAVSDLLNNPVVTKLRQQYLELVARETEFSNRYGSGHAAVVNLRNQVRDLQNAIFNELRRLSDSYRSEYLISKQRRDAIEADLARSVAQAQTMNRAQGALRELESNAASARSIYEVFLQRYTESLQQQTHVMPEARILAPGTAQQKIPLRPAVILALSLFGGLGCGLGLAFMRVALDRVFRTSKQLEGALQVPCAALLPLVKTRSKVKGTPTPLTVTVADPRLIVQNDSVFWTVVGAPLSRFAEAIRALKLTVDLHQLDGLSTVLGFTSALPNEGKTTAAAALALLMGQVGHRVIVVDCDLRNPSLTRALAPNAAIGLLEVLSGENTLDEASWHCPITGLTFLPTVLKPGLSHTSEILASSATKKLFEQLRRDYDYVVIDLPPLAPIIDVRATGHLVDFYFLVVEWGGTKVDVVKHALTEARPVIERLLGTVLNKTDFAEMSHYDRNRSQYYHNEHYGKYLDIDMSANSGPLAGSASHSSFMSRLRG